MADKETKRISSLKELRALKRSPPDTIVYTCSGQCQVDADNALRSKDCAFGHIVLFADDVDGARSGRTRGIYRTREDLEIGGGITGLTTQKGVNCESLKRLPGKPPLSFPCQAVFRLTRLDKKPAG